MSLPGYQLKQRHKVVASLSGEDIGKEVWVVICNIHPKSEVLNGICEECWRDGRRGVLFGSGLTLEQARALIKSER